MVTNSSYAPEFVLVGEEEPPQRRYWSKGASWVLVVLIHVLFFGMLTFSVRMPTYGSRSALETILFLPSLEGRQAPDVHMIQPVAPSDTAPEIITAPITLPKPPPPPEAVERPATQGDVLKAVGEELSCGAGSFEHLTQAERNRCRHEPWAGARTAAGTLVLAPSAQIPRLRPRRPNSASPAPMPSAARLKLPPPLPGIAQHPLASTGRQR